jgi:hypothetical protein
MLIFIIACCQVHRAYREPDLHYDERWIVGDSITRGVVSDRYQLEAMPYPRCVGCTAVRATRIHVDGGS